MRWKFVIVAYYEQRDIYDYANKNNKKSTKHANVENVRVRFATPRCCAAKYYQIPCFLWMQVQWSCHMARRVMCNKPQTIAKFCAAHKFYTSPCHDWRTIRFRRCHHLRLCVWCAFVRRLRQFAGLDYLLTIWRCVDAPCRRKIKLSFMFFRKTFLLHFVLLCFLLAVFCLLKNIINHVQFQFNLLHIVGKQLCKLADGVYVSVCVNLEREWLRIANNVCMPTLVKCCTKTLKIYILLTSTYEWFSKSDGIDIWHLICANFVFTWRVVLPPL